MQLLLGAILQIGILQTAPCYSQVVAHMGPTNSGKTHAALQALKAAETGVYCGPLRLLAWEACLCQCSCLTQNNKERDLLGGFISQIPSP